MKDLDVAWSHIVAKKLQKIRDDRGMTFTELGEKIGATQSFVSMLLGRKAKGNEENFTKIGMALGMPKRDIDDMLYSSLFEAIEQEYGVGVAFALKIQFGLSEGAIRDVMMFIKDIQKKERDKNS